MEVAFTAPDLTMILALNNWKDLVISFSKYNYLSSFTCYSCVIPHSTDVISIALHTLSKQCNFVSPGNNNISYL